MEKAGEDPLTSLIGKHQHPRWQPGVDRIELHSNIWLSVKKAIHGPAGGRPHRLKFRWAAFFTRCFHPPQACSLCKKASLAYSA